MKSDGAELSRTLRLKGADGDEIEIPAREFYLNVKARTRRLMRDSLSGDARRVYACLELATMGYRQELAVTMEGGKRRPLTPGDIKAQTGLLKQNVTRALVELEEAGLVLRRSDDGGPIRNGHILIFSWAIPRAAAQKGTRARLPFPSWFPAEWEPLKPLISRFKMRLVEDEGIARDYFEEGSRVARDYQEAESVAARFLERVRAEAVSGGIREIKERKIEIKGAPPLPPPLSAATETPATPSPATAKTEEEEPRPTYQNFKALYPAQRFDDDKSKPFWDKIPQSLRPRIFERLRVYLACERWQRSLSENNGRFIPFASKWLASYEADPPPYVEPPRKGGRGDGGDETLRILTARAEGRLP